MKRYRLPKSLPLAATRTIAFLMIGVLPARCAPTQNHSASPPLGILVQGKGESATKFMPWQSEATVHQALAKISGQGGGTISFLPGEYVIPQGFSMTGLRNITIRGTDGVRLTFAPSPEITPRLTQAVEQGQDFLMVDRPDLLKVGWKYQVYPETHKGDRILEFRVQKVGEDRVWISPNVHFMGHVKAIPEGSIVFEHVNFFNINRCDSITLEGLHLDGMQRGSVHGHTTFCGVLAVGNYKVGERPINQDLHIRNCTFRGLKGRGIAAYGMGNMVVEGCYFSDIDSQAIEIDHFSSGVVRFNEVHDSGVGIALNDAFESQITNNLVFRCDSAISFVKHFDHDWVNRGNLVEGNLIVQAKLSGISFLQTMSGNVIRGNFFKDTDKKKWVVNDTGNTVTDSAQLP